MSDPTGSTVPSDQPSDAPSSAPSSAPPTLPSLRPGIRVIEASAGTGKTHALTSLAVRAVAEGLPLHQVLLMSFTRSTTAELRDRVRRRLLAAEEALTAFLEHGTRPGDDVADEYCTGPDVAGPARDRLHEAVAEFDAATIVTIHGFCQRVLDQTGVHGDVDLDVRFVEDLRDLRDEVVDDLLIQKFSRSLTEDETFVTRPRALRIADAVLMDTTARIVPLDPEPDGDKTTVSLAEAIRRRVGERKRERRILGYDDLLIRLRDVLVGPDGPGVAERLRRTYRLVVVDEFQDTDTVQWDIMRLAFGRPPTTLVLIGDPKQAIYSFRGADIHAYLAARDAAGGAIERLETNWRSDAGLLSALDAVFGEARLGHDAIAYRPSRPAEAHLGPGLVGGRRPLPLRIRHLRLDSPGATVTDSGKFLEQRWAQERIARDLAADVVHQLANPPQLPREGRHLRAGDIAVLVSRNADADTVQEALQAAGVPAVVNGTGNVFATEAAGHWATLLRALERPSYDPGVRSLALTPFLGWSATDVDSADEGRWDEVHDALRRWRTVLVDEGVAALFERVQASTDLPARLLAQVDGERALTDLRHVTELLHHHATHEDPTPTGLSGWLRDQILDADRVDSEATRRRLDTDADAVQVWTVHRSKGLEFPVVYLPFLWRPPHFPKSFVPTYHDPDHGRVVAVTEPRRGVARAIDERRGEDLRLTYVALTRARHQVVLWWAATYHAPESSLARLVLDPFTGGDIRGPVPDDTVRSALDLVGAAAPDLVSVEPIGTDEPERITRPDAGDDDLGVATFDRPLDPTWRRTSYSALTAAAHAGGFHAAATGPGVGAPASAPEHAEAGLTDERMIGDDPEEDPTSDPTLGAVPVADPGVAGAGADGRTFAGLPGGAEFGTMVHAVLEHVDFAAPDLRAEIGLALGRTAGRAIDPEHRVAVTDGLIAAIETPLGPLAGGARLRDLARTDRLDELGFEFALAGGDHPRGHLTMAAIAELVARHVPADDPLGAYAAHLADPGLAQSVRGFLSGSIDLVMRVDGRFYVVDYKSNRLGRIGQPTTPEDYRPEALTEAMIRAHYPLQALLYSVALHRYLRGRLGPGDPDERIGGILYLFLRGMVGADAPTFDGTPSGVFSWRPPAGLVVELSDLLDRGAP